MAVARRHNEAKTRARDKVDEQSTGPDLPLAIWNRFVEVTAS
jgi:hypothetical protein